MISTIIRMSKIKKAFEICRNDGLITLGQRSSLYLRNRIRQYWIRLEYWQTNGILDVSLDLEKETIKLKLPPNKYRYLKQFNGYNERNVLVDISQEVEPADTFYDIGANIGLYTCMIGQKVQRVVAFEPYPPNKSYVVENVNLNNIDAEVYDVALSNKSGTTELALPNQKAGESRTAIKADWNIDSPTITINMAQGDTFICEEGIPSPDVMKIDVEGAELKVLEGMSDEIKTCRLVYCETHPERLPDYGGSINDIKEFFASHGFQTEVIHTRENSKFQEQYYLKAKNETF